MIGDATGSAFIVYSKSNVFFAKVKVTVRLAEMSYCKVSRNNLL